MHVAEKDNNFYLNLESYHDDIIDFIKTIDGSKYIGEKFGEEHVWKVPANKNSVKKLDLLNVQIEVNQTAISAWNKLKEKADQDAQDHRSYKDVDVSDYDPIYDHWDHQKKALKMSRIHDNLGLLYEMGAGKTKSAIDISFYRFQKGEISSALILCPLSIKQVWFKELKEHAPERYDIIDLHCNNKKKRRKTNLRKMKDYNKEDGIMTFGITTYDSAWRMTDKIIDCNFDSAIADESTEIKNHKAKRSKGAHKIAKADGLGYRLILTGTAITNSALDAWSQFEFLDPSIFPDSYYQFEQKYAIKGGWQNKVVVSYRNLDELKQKIHSISLRVTKDECLDLPDKVFTERYVQLSKDEKDAYDQLKKEAILHLNEQDNVTVNNILAELAKLQQLANGFIHYEDIDFIEKETERETKRFGKSKLNELERTIRQADDKVVVWAQYRKDIEYIEEMLEDNFDFNFVSLHGGTSQKSGKLEKKFHNDDNTKVFISQIQTGAKGIDLTPANTAIYYSNTFSLDNYLQSQDRLHREGQENKVTYIRLISENTVDERIVKSLQENKKIAMEIMDDVKSGPIDDI